MPPPTNPPPHPPSPFFFEYLDTLREAARLGPILDLACGSGRHARELAQRGLACVAIDRNAEELSALRRQAKTDSLMIVRADLETEYGLPFRPGSFGAILVFRFLFRPLAKPIVDALAPGGLLLYETFTHDQPKLNNGPRNEHFLLAERELLSLFPTLSPIAYDEGLLPDVLQPHYLARLAAQKAGTGIQ